MKNIYLPNLMTIKDIIQETPDIKTFRLQFKYKEEGEDFIFLPGQFCEFSVFGEGESTFCIASSPTKKDYIECSIKKIGKVTTAIHDLKIGDIIGIRGPYGKSFPMELIKNNNILFIGGGIGLAPLRSLIQYCLDNRNNYRRIDIVYGARTPQDLVYTNEFSEWGKSPETNVYITVDKAVGDWTGHIDFVPKYLEELNLSSTDTVAITCGPPIMIKIVMGVLTKLGFSDDKIVTSCSLRSPAILSQH